ncbi:MAG: EamA family transporter [Actinomycetes bacterium]
MSALLALTSSLLWGTADFLGGTASRRLPAVAVVGVSQALGLVGVLVMAVATGELDASPGYLGWGIAGGATGLVALTAFYAGLASGTMGVVAPIAATGVVVPVGVGLLRGESPQPWQAAGILLAVVGVVLASGPEARGGTGVSLRPLLLAGVAAAGFGLVLVFLAEGGRTSTPMTLVAMRATSVLLVVGVAVAVRSSGGFRTADLPLLAVIGLADAGANATYAFAAQSGLVSVTAVLASLYPAVTVLLARGVHGERMRRIQNVGVSCALGGVVLIAAGG